MKKWVQVRNSREDLMFESKEIYAITVEIFLKNMSVLKVLSDNSEVIHI